MLVVLGRDVNLDVRVAIIRGRQRQRRSSPCSGPKGDRHAAPAVDMPSAGQAALSRTNFNDHAAAVPLLGCNLSS